MIAGWQGGRRRGERLRGGAEPSGREPLDILGRGEIGLAPGLKTSHPTPAQRVGGRISVQQVSHEEIGPQRPWQLQSKDPD